MDSKKIWLLAYSEESNTKINSLTFIIQPLGKNTEWLTSMAFIEFQICKTFSIGYWFWHAIERK